MRLVTAAPHAPFGGSRAEQRALVEAELKTPLVAWRSMYLVDSAWLRLWEVAAAFDSEIIHENSCTIFSLGLHE